MFNLLTFMAKVNLTEWIETFAVPTGIASTFVGIGITGALKFFRRKEKNALNRAVASVVSLDNSYAKVDTNVKLLVNSAQEMYKASKELYEIGKLSIEEAKAEREEIKVEKVRLQEITQAFYGRFFPKVEATDEQEIKEV